MSQTPPALNPEHIPHDPRDQQWGPSREHLEQSPPSAPTVLPSGTKQELNQWYYIQTDIGKGYYQRFYQYPDKSATVSQYSKTKPNVPYNILAIPGRRGTPMTSQDMVKALSQEPGAYGPATPQNLAYVQQMTPTWESMKFWGNLGYPEYGGVYAPIDIPAGAKISEITQSASGGLLVKFMQAPSPIVPPEVMAVHHPKAIESMADLTTQGQVDLPLPPEPDIVGKTWLVGTNPLAFIHHPKVLQNFEDINAPLEDEIPTYEMTPEAKAIYERTLDINTKLQGGLELDITDYAFISKNYPDIAKQMASAQTEQTKIELINQKLQSGQELDILEALTISSKQPEIAKQLASQAAYNTKILGINEKLASGQPLDIYEALTISKNAPGVARQLAKQSAVNELMERTNLDLSAGKPLDIYEALAISKNAPELARQLAKQAAVTELVERTNLDLASGNALDIYEALAISKNAPDIAKQLAMPIAEAPTGPVGGITVSYVNRAAQKQSQIFYQNIGHPEFGGEYAPFEVPKGQQIASITETSTGELNVKFESIVKPTLADVFWKGAGEGLKAGVTALGVPRIIGAGAMESKIPSVSTFLYQQGKGMQAKESAFPLGIPKQSSGMFALAGLTQAVENTFVPMSRAEPITSLGGKPTPYIAGYGLGLLAIYGPVAYSGAKLVQAKLEPWGEEYLTSQYDAAVKAGKPTTSGYFTTERPAYEFDTGFMKEAQVASDTIGGSGLGWKAKVIQAITGASPKGLPPAIVGFPTVQEGAVIGAPYQELSLESGALLERTVVPSSTQAWAGGMDIFEFTNAPRVSGYGITQPPFVASIAKTPTDVFSLESGGLSSILGQWFYTHPVEVPQQGPLSFTKRPQTYRPAEEGVASFSKQVGALPSQDQLLAQILAEESKPVAGAGGMQNVFGTATETMQQTITKPFVPVGLGDMTSWLLKQEVQAKVVQKSGITPIVVPFQVQGQLIQSQYDVGEVVYPNVPLTEQLTLASQVEAPQMRESVLTLLPLQSRLSVSEVSQKDNVVVPLLELPQIKGKTPTSVSILTPNVTVTSKPKTGLPFAVITETGVKQKQVVPPILNVESFLDLESGISLLPQVTTKFGVKPKTEVATLPKTIVTQQPSVPYPVLSPLKLSLPKNPLGSLGGGGGGKKENAGMTFLFGRQKRKYPIMSGGEAAKFLYPTGEQKRRKKK